MLANLNGDEMEVSCPVCQEEYDEVNARYPMSQACGHTICQRCSENMKDTSQQSGFINCPTCRQRNSVTSLIKNYCLGDALSVIKKLREKPVPKNSVQCGTCEKVDTEADMFVCRKCINEVFKFDVFNNINRNAEFDLKTAALCGSCAIRDHVKLGHEAVAYFPVSSGIQFENHLSSISLLRKDLNEQVDRTDQWYLEFGETVHKFNEQLDKMTDMMRKSTSSNAQQSFMTRIDEEIKKVSKNVLTVCNTIRNEQIELNDGYNNLVELNTVDETQKCREIVEGTADGKCNDCNAREPFNKMFCCCSCSEIVGELMNDKLETAKIGHFELESLPICTYCVISSHHGEMHKIEKYELVCKKYRSAVRLSNVQAKEKLLNERFSQLLSTFDAYVTILHDYDNKISQMSKIASGSRGHPDHDVVVNELHKVLEEAESVISALQANAMEDKCRVQGRNDALETLNDQMDV